MHSFDAPSGATYHHNGDFSGSVQFEAEVEPEYGAVKDVEVPFADLKALVAEYVRRNRVEVAESVTDDEVLGVIKPNYLLSAELHTAHRAVLALRAMLIAAGVRTELLNSVVGAVTCAFCHLAPITEDHDPELSTVEALPEQSQGVTSARRLIKLQPASFVDNITEKGHVGTKLPYPFYVTEAGDVEGQDFWRGDPLKVVGFQKDLARHEVDLWWDDAVKEPQKAVGLYLVTTDSKGGMGVHQTAIASVEVLER